MPKTRYRRADDIKCPKCQTLNQHGQRKIQYVAETSRNVNGTVVITPEFLAVYCFTCGYKLGEFDPADADDDGPTP